ncbi:MAG TPA: FemAB family XrtA/PEP-CTERM system-associated protein [Gemmatimonadaceae bacterium]|nr:FemAB family XrtA/PEP-CTERM system-associated protein [Gemmatimonadaceae bacterium]
MHVSTFTGDAAEWDALVRRSPGWTHFHLSGWRSVIGRVFGHECLYLSARTDDGHLAGVLPLVRVKSVAFGHYLVSMPFLNYGGPLGSERATQALVSHAVELAERDDVKLLELRSRVPLPVRIPVSHRKITVLLDLPRDPDVLWKQLDAKVRSQVRRPRKEGVTVRFGASEVEPFFQVFSRHMRDLGTPTQPLKFFEAIAEHFPEDAWFSCAYYQGRAIAAGCALRWADEVEMTWASALVEYKRIAANMLLYWSFMERAIHDGARVFNFGRCTPGEGTHRFKLQWGSRDEPLWWYDLATRPGTTTPSPKDSGYAWGPRVWKKLPVSVATALGPRIVQYIP